MKNMQKTINFIIIHYFFNYQSGKTKKYKLLFISLRAKSNIYNTLGMKILQLRATAFITRNIGYRPEIANEIKKILDLDGQIEGFPMPGFPVNTFNPKEPQLDMPWSLVKLRGTDTTYKVNFLPGKIDIIVNHEEEYNIDVERKFLKQCSNWFIQICEKYDVKPSRLAYAPLFVIISEKDLDLDNRWEKLVTLSSFNGSLVQDLNLSFNYKIEFELADKAVQLNLYHHIYDGTQTIQHKKDSKTTHRVIMLQLDLNTIASEDYSFSSKDLISFFNEIKNVKTQIVKEFQNE